MAVFSTKPYDRTFLTEANEGHGHDLEFFEARLGPRTAQLAAGFEAVCPFVNDRLDKEVLHSLAGGGTRLLALRSAGFNHVDVPVAVEIGMTVARVPAYSPDAVAEHAAALVLSLNRRIHRAYARVRDGNFALDGLMGFDLRGRTVGVVGTGKIGTAFVRIMRGFSCEVLAVDVQPNPECEAMGARYVQMDELLRSADVIALHCPLTPQTHHLIDAEAIAKMKPGVMLINTSRGGLVDTQAVIEGLKEGHIGYLGLDVYEEEADLFFEDLSQHVITDDVFMRLLTFPNVIVTGHQAFFTADAVRAIARTTIENVTAFESGAGEIHTVPPED